MQQQLKKVYLKYLHESELISKNKIEKYGLESIADVEKYAREHFDIELPIEIAYQGRILAGADEIPTDTDSTDNCLKVYLKFIKDPGESTVSEKFFTIREINVNFGISIDCSFESCVEEMSRPQKVAGGAIDAVRKAYSLHSHENEPGKGYIIGRVLEEAIELEEAATYLIVAGKAFSVPSFPKTHTSISDHYIYNKETHRAILISEDKNLDLHQAMLQNFDQLLTYSYTPEGLNQRYFYGMISTLKEWRFCLYIKPDQGRAALYDNFKVSKIISLNIDNTGKPAVESVKCILLAIRGFLSANADQIVEKQ